MTGRILARRALRLLLLSVGFWGCRTEHDSPGGAEGGGGGGSAGIGGAGVAGTGNENGGAAGDATSTSDGGDVGGSGGGGGAGTASGGEGGSGTTNGGGGGYGGVSTAEAGSGGGGGCGARGVTPTVLLMIDNSASMFDPRESRWDPLFSVLMKPTDGIVATFQSQVRFGFTSYRGTRMAGDPQCPLLFEADYALDNFDAINARYSAQNAEFSEGVNWSTPTGAAIAKVAQKLAATTSAPPGPKYIVLVTDGKPSTCATVDPPCGSDESTKAVQDARALGITMFVIGIGDLTGPTGGCEGTWGQCDTDFLQDMANAGSGLPVHAPPEDLKYQACTPSHVLAAAYAAPSEAPGTATYYATRDAAHLDAAFREILSSVLSCE